MPDTPDYYKYLPNSNRFSLQDLGELAARLGSVHVFDRRGEIIFYEVFNQGLGGWFVNSSGAGSSISLNATHVYRFPYTAKLVCGTSGTKFAAIQKRMGGVNTARIGLEICWALEFGDYLIRAGVDVNNGMDNFRVEFDYNANTHEWRITDENGDQQVIFNKSMEIGSSFVFVPVKIVADINTRHYVRMLISDDEVDISNYGLFVSPGGTAVNYSVSVTNLGDGSTNTELYIAAIILTANEP